MSGEEWRPVPGFDGYEVSNLGRVRSWKPWRKVPAPRILRPVVKRHKGGYAQYGLMDPNGRLRFFWGHRLVLETFVGPRPSGLQTRHLDGDPLNNSLSNLAYGTAQENAQDKVTHRRARERLSAA